MSYNFDQRNAHSPVEWLLYDLLTEIRGLRNDMADMRTILLEMYKPSGKTWGFEGTFTIGSPLTIIDFTGENEHQNLPDGFKIYIPHKPAYDLILTNEGPADIRWGTNDNEHVYLSILRGKVPLSETREIRINREAISQLYILPIPTVGATTAFIRGDIVT